MYFVVLGIVDYDSKMQYNVIVKTDRSVAYEKNILRFLCVVGCNSAF